MAEHELTVGFLKCWNGDATSSDGKSHVTFSNGACPKNFPHRIPSILLETVWLTSEFDAIRDQAMDPDQPYVFSTGDTTGYSLHADFQHGWDNDVLTKAMKQCTNENFDPSGCSPLSIGSNGQCFRVSFLNTVATFSAEVDGSI